MVEGEGGPRLRLTTADLASSGSLVLPAGALNASRHEALLKCEAAAVPGRRCPRANPHPHPHPKPKPKPNPDPNPNPNPNQALPPRGLRPPSLPRDLVRVRLRLRLRLRV